MYNPFAKETLVQVPDPFDADHRYRFAAPNRRILKRAKKIGTKEPGTVEWLNKALRDDDILLDIGANVGVYTVFAAHRVPRGRVYAIEPHAGNFAVLLKTIELNQYAERITPLSVALDSESQWIEFSYNTLDQGSSGSQLATSPTSSQYGKAVSEQKLAHTVDELIRSGAMKTPTVVKIDVDGNELNILNGMHNLLAVPTLRTLQIEIDYALESGIVSFMQAAGFEMDHRHYSARGLKELKANNVEKAYPYNAVFTRRTA